MRFSSSKGPKKLEEQMEKFYQLLLSFAGQSEISVVMKKDNEGIEERLELLSSITEKGMTHVKESLDALNTKNSDGVEQEVRTVGGNLTDLIEIASTINGKLDGLAAKDTSSVESEIAGLRKSTSEGLKEVSYLVGELRRDLNDNLTTMIEALDYLNQPFYKKLWRK